jgi:diketogulonate reductase-like aldo/keto reductase
MNAPTQASAPTPRIIYGTAWKKADTSRLVTLAIEHGFRAIDTACQPKHYNEAGVGEGIAAALGAGLSRGDLFIQTKFTPVSGQDPASLPYDPDAALAVQVAQSFKASQRHLQTDYVDSLILHSPLAHASQTLEAWRAMEALVASGQVKRLGISNCYDLGKFKALYDAAVVKPWALQNRFHDETGYDIKLRAFCAEHGIVYQSFWTLTANAHILAHPDVVALAAHHQCLPAQVLFRYLTQSGVTPLTGTTSAQHMQEDLAIFAFELGQAELATMDRLISSSADPVAA